MTAPSIAMARQSVEHLIALHEIHSDGSMQTICANAKHACVVLAWLERRQELIRAMEELERRAPYMADLLREFPNSRIETVRSYDDDEHHDTLG